MYILGIGAAFPETKISNDLLTQLHPSLAAHGHIHRSGIIERRSVLPKDYIETGNLSSKQAEKQALESPTSLAFRAAEIALKRAGIEAEQIGLVIGDCTTPRQTTPSEAQRLAARFDLKVPAYDIAAAQGSFFAHCSDLSRWKPERCPDYILCISTHTPTQSINYKASVGGIYFGDGASAYILSPRISGTLKINHASFSIDSARTADVHITTYEFFELPENYIEVVVRPGFQSVFEARKNELDKNSYVIGPQSDYYFVQDYLTGSCGFSESQILSHGRIYGDIIGASTSAVIATHWDTLVPGKTIGVFDAGLGLQGGYLNLTVEK